MFPLQEPAPEEVRVRRVRGHGLPIVRASLKVALTEDGWEAYLAELSPAGRAFLATPPDPEVWVVAEVISEVMRTFLRQKGRDLNHVQGDLAGEAYAAMGGPTFAAPENLLGAVPHLWGHAFDGGICRAEVQGPGQGEIRIWAVVPYDPWMSGFLKHWFRTALGACGVTEVHVAYEPPVEGSCCHRYRCTWR